MFSFPQIHLDEQLESSSQSAIFHSSTASFQVDASEQLTTVEIRFST